MDGGRFPVRLFKDLARRRARAQPRGSERPAPEQLLTVCKKLISGVDESSFRFFATQALSIYRQLSDEQKLFFFRCLLMSCGGDTGRLDGAYHEGECSRGHAPLPDLTATVEPVLQELLPRLNHADAGTLALVEMRADLRRLQGDHPELMPLERDFRYLLESWFSHGSLRMEQVTWNSPKELLQCLLAYEKVHPIANRSELRRRLQPKDRRCYAFFHPATGDIPLIFVELALVRGVPTSMQPLLGVRRTLRLSKADTAVFYSINNSLEGLAGIAFGSLLIKQVIEKVGQELPHVENFVTLSPIPGFRAWLEAGTRAEQGTGKNTLTRLQKDLEQFGASLDMGTKEWDEEFAEGIRPRLFQVLARYIATEQRIDGKPVDPVARFHLGNGAAAWQLNWPSNTAEYGWNESYGAMINYRYRPELPEQQNVKFIRYRGVSLGEQFGQMLAESEPLTRTSTEWVDTAESAAPRPNPADLP